MIALGYEESMGLWMLRGIMNLETKKWEEDFGDTQKRIRSIVRLFKCLIPEARVFMLLHDYSEKYALNYVR